MDGAHGDGRHVEVPPVRGAVVLRPEIRCARRKARNSGKYFRVWMRKLNLSYAQVAFALGVHEITVRKWEKQKLVKPIVKLAFDQVFRSKPKHKVIEPQFVAPFNAPERW